MPLAPGCDDISSTRSIGTVVGAEAQHSCHRKRELVIGGIPITALSPVEWAELMVQDCQANTDRSAIPKFMTSANGFVLSLYARDPEFKKLLDQADGIDADGMPLVLVSRMLARAPLPERVATTDFFHVAARFAEGTDISFFFLGSAEDENRVAVERVSATYPRLQIAGRHHGHFTEEEEAAVVQQIATAKPDVLWVGMGVPREHQFIVRNRTRLTGVSWIKSCGGLFKFLSGKDRRAPCWMQELCLEWIFRLAREPQRLFMRYYRSNGHAVYLMYKHRAFTRGATSGMAPKERQVTRLFSG
jgi:N-acetylglucosaminyldiphosphoundecaprenol N-acetyl-beta-D-mannosaminyltransferase